MELFIRLGRPRIGYDIAADEEVILQEFIERTDLRWSDDIWTMTCGEVSLARCNAAFVPCFFGLDLVRFDYTSLDGRCLRII